MGSCISVLDDGVALDRAIAQGSKMLSQPRACISVCRSADCGPKSTITWAIDTPAEAQSASRGPAFPCRASALLRSHNQHVALSTALQLKCERQEEEKILLKAELEYARGQAELNLHLKTELELAHGNLPGEFEQRQSQPPLTRHPLFDLDPEPDGRSALEQRRAAPVEVEALWARCEEYRSANQELESDLAIISTEANEKIEAANDHIRTMKLRHEDTKQALKSVQSDMKSVQSENRKLVYIIQQLHDTCNARGLQTTDFAKIIGSEYDIRDQSGA